jgi:hypothetical protein
LVRLGCRRLRHQRSCQWPPDGHARFR